MATRKDGVIEPTATLPIRPTESFMDYLQRRATDRIENANFEITAGQVDAILSAANEDDMWNADERDSIGGRDLEDVELRIYGFTVHRESGQFKAPLKHYFMVDAARLSDGERFLFDTSAPLVMAKLRWLESQELLPADVVIRGTSTPNGTVLKLKPISQRPVQTSVS